MSCNSHLGTFKPGGAFTLALRLMSRDDATQVSTPVDVTNSEFAATLRDKHWRVITPLQIIKNGDQVANAGYIYLHDPDTSDWPVGDAVIDIKSVIEGVSKPTRTYTITLEKAVTP